VPALPTPWFYSVFRRLNIDVPLEMSLAAAITFGDTIVVRDSRYDVLDWYPLLFHELVHVVQYAILGLDTFIAHYLRALVDAAMDYNENPFEREACALWSRFESAPRIPFNLETEVRSSRLTLTGQAGSVKRTVR
jgi:Domain of unknown function (DUF4157)